MFEIRVIGLRRSGNHAILNWIAGLCEGTVWFLNDCLPSVDPLMNRKETNILPCLDRHLPISGDNPSVLLHSYEDRRLTHLLKQPRDSERWRVAKRFDILVLRDPFNTLASRLEAAKKSDWFVSSKNGAEFNLLWKQHAREFARRTKYFPNLIPVSFNRWFSHEQYRRKIATILGQQLNDSTIDQVSRQGQGSSFDGLDVRGQQMQVLHRWKRYQTDPIFREAFDDKELLELSHTLFPEVTAKAIHAFNSPHQARAE